MKHFNHILATQTHNSGYNLAQEGIIDSVKDGYKWVISKFKASTVEEAVQEAEKRVDKVDELMGVSKKVMAKLQADKSTGPYKVAASKLFRGTNFAGKTADEFLAALKAQVTLIKQGKAPTLFDSPIEHKGTVEFTKQYVADMHKTMVELHAIVKQSTSVSSIQAMVKKANGGAALESVMSVLSSIVYFISVVIRVLIFWWICWALCCTIIVPVVLVLFRQARPFFGGLWNIMFPEMQDTYGREVRASEL